MGPAETLYCGALAGLPDRIETLGRIRVLKHRGWSHDLVLWGGACVAAFYLSTAGAIPDHIFVRSWVIPLPGLLHLLGDVLTPSGIHFLGLRIRIPLFKTGSAGEVIFVGLVAVGAILSVKAHGWL